MSNNPINSTGKQATRRGNAKYTTSYLIKIAILSALAYVVMFLEFPLPIFPPFLKMDFSDLVPLLGAFAMGPAAGVLIELIKNLIHWMTVSSTGGVGEIGNFVVGAAFVATAGLMYKHFHTRKGAIAGLAASIVAMIVSGAIVNYFITIPLYGAVLGLSTEAIVGMSRAVIPAIHDKFTLILYAFCPFNLIKGVVLSVLAFPLYKFVSPFLKMQGRD